MNSPNENYHREKAGRFRRAGLVQLELTEAQLEEVAEMFAAYGDDPDALKGALYEVMQVVIQAFRTNRVPAVEEIAAIMSPLTLDTLSALDRYLAARSRLLHGLGGTA